jgi:hypothetical protein
MIRGSVCAVWDVDLIGVVLIDQGQNLFDRAVMKSAQAAILEIQKMNIGPRNAKDGSGIDGFGLSQASKFLFGHELPVGGSAIGHKDAADLGSGLTF